MDRHRIRLGVPGILIPVLLGLFLHWPQPCQGQKNVDEPAGNRLAICLPGSVDTLDPTDYRSRETQMVIKAMFDSLTTRDGDMNVVPQLAESFEALNSTLWEFRLKKGVHFHNGDVMTARDVRFTFERVIRDGAINGHTSARQSLFGPLTDVIVVNDYTVRFKTMTPWPILPLMMTLQEIVPETYMTTTGTSGFVQAPVGTGPFRFVEKKNDHTFVLERFKGYHASSTLAPSLESVPVNRLVFIFESDMVRRIAMLKRGDVDIISQVPPESLSMFELNPDIHVLACPASRSYFAELNCRKKPFDDRRVRIAMNYAMDMRMIVNTVLRGRGQVLPTLLLPEAFSYDPSLNPYPYVPEKAISLLKETGFKMDHTMTIYCQKTDESFAGAIAHYLSRIGIRSRITTGEKQGVIDAMKTGKADMLVSSWGNTSLDPVGILLPKLSKDGRGNYSGYSNIQVDELFSKAESTLDQESRKNLYRDIQRIIHDDAPMIFGYSAEEFYAVRSRVRGFRPTMTGMLDLNDVSIEKGNGP